MVKRQAVVEVNITRNQPFHLELRTYTLADLLGGRYRVSNNGVPHIVRKFRGVLHSVCYFRSTGTWRIFFPYMRFGDEQTKITMPDEKAVCRFFHVACPNFRVAYEERRIAVNDNQ